MGRFRQCLTELYARDTIMSGYYSLTFLFFVLFIVYHKGARGKFRNHLWTSGGLYLIDINIDKE